MGVTDSTTHTLECECGASESVRMVEYGSSYGASWQSGKAMAKFDVVWDETSPGGPRISEVKCRSCGAEPAIQVS
jgi:hypothetical protein